MTVKQIRNRIIATVTVTALFFLALISILIYSTGARAAVVKSDLLVAREVQTQDLKPTPDKVNKTWFIQVWSSNESVIEVDDGVTDVGRVEVTDGEGKFVACARFFLVKNWNGFIIAPLDFGFMFTGDKDKLKVELYGEAKRRIKVNVKATDPTL